jgi:hypothetical protein
MWEKLSHYEDNNNNSFLDKAGQEAAKNAINENKALGLPITYFKDGWVVREMADGKVEKIKRVEERKVPKEIVAKKGITIYVGE